MSSALRRADERRRFEPAAGGRRFPDPPRRAARTSSRTSVPLSNAGEPIRFVGRRASDAVLRRALELTHLGWWQTAERVGVERPNVRIVHMSAAPDATDREGLEPGINYLPKPFTLDALARILRNALAR